MIQPVVIRCERKEIYRVAGAHRLRAARAVGLKEIPAILTEAADGEIETFLDEWMRLSEEMDGLVQALGRAGKGADKA